MQFNVDKVGRYPSASVAACVYHLDVKDICTMIDLELPADDQVLVSQAGHLLEEPDITNVLNTIQPDEFNDFFTGNKIRIFLCAFLVCIGSQCNLTILIN